MPGAATPQTLLEPIASDAGGGFITNPMPDAPTGTNAASVQQGFPPVTMQEELAGGQPPLGQDMNGYLFLISSHTMYVQCGQLYQFNPTLVADIGGYLIGTILGMADGTGAWLNTVNGNSTNPDTGGAGWFAINSSGHSTMTGLTTGTATLSVAQWKKGVIYFSGALTGNVQVVFPTIDSERWLCINNCTGAHTLTARTAAGTGVVIPAGGNTQPTGIYCDGANIQFSTTPLTIPIDQAPTPSTIVERDNLGNVLAVRFNSDAGLEVPATLGAVVVQNSGLDGFFRSISLANFAAKALGFVANIIANNGSFTLLGITLKWGNVNIPASGGATVGFTNAFSSACYAVVLTPAIPTNGTNYTTAVSAASFSCDNSNGALTPTYWFAIGK